MEYWTDIELVADYDIKLAGGVSLTKTLETLVEATKKLQQRVEKLEANEGKGFIRLDYKTLEDATAWTIRRRG